MVIPLTPEALILREKKNKRKTMMNEQELKSEIEIIGGMWYSAELQDRQEYLKYKLKQLQAKKGEDDE
jgi:hypothetical protein